MNKLIRSYLVCILLLFHIVNIAQNKYLNKTVILQSGHFSLKAALKIISDQTGCVFSYDPTIIIDKQELRISTCNKIPLFTVLQKILPKTIHFKFKEKYVLLQKADFSKNVIKEIALKNQSLQVKDVSVTSNIEIKTLENIQNDSIKLDKKINYSITDLENTLKKRGSVLTLPITEKEVSKLEFQPIAINLPDTIKPTKVKLKPVLEIELAENNHLVTFSTHIGINSLYAIISIGSDYYKSYHLGVGAGINLKLSKYFGLNLDLIQYALVAGESYKIKVRATTTQISPELNFTFGQRYKLFAGPSVYLIKSRFVKGSSNVDLGNFTGYSAILGIRIELSKPAK